LETEQYQDFNDSERAAIQYARDLTAEASANESGEALYKIFNDEQVVEITLVTAMANFTNRFNNGLGVQPEQ
jgi:alkylhydroperoxidase family enzyme